MAVSQRCSQCGRAIGSHLGYGTPGSAAQLCYRCHRKSAGSTLPAGLQNAWETTPRLASQLWIIRLGAAVMIVMTAAIVWETRNVGHALIGFAGLLLFLALGRRTRKPSPPRQDAHTSKPD